MKTKHFTANWHTYFSDHCNKR